MRAWLLLAWLASGNGVVAVRVSPEGFQFEPGYIVVTVTVERHDDNRRLALDVVGGMDSFTERQLDGAAAPRVQQFLFKDVPAGHYVVTARVFSSVRERGRASDETEVLSRR